MRRIGWINKKPVYEGNENNIPKGALHIDDLQGGKISYYKLDCEVLKDENMESTILQMLSPFIHTSITCDYDGSNAEWDPNLYEGKVGATVLISNPSGIIDKMLSFRQYIYILH